ncbi:MAG TPA: hypothetical protein VM536_22460 [Chloroflexia bacterium]|nr:hypothetical protein [Chloroflexia bacterium]
MESETRHLPASDPARVPSSYPVPPVATGTATSYLPPTPGVPPQAQTHSYEAPVAARPPERSSYAPPASRTGWQGAQRPGGLPLVLLGLGFLMLFGGAHLVFGAAIPLALGLIFLYVSRQGPGRQGFRIPAYILTGLGAGIVMDAMTTGDHGGYAALGLGLGFVALWARDHAQWWWLIPGAIVGLSGLQGVVGGYRFHGGGFVPLALILLAVYLFSRRGNRIRI